MNEVDITNIRQKADIVDIVSSYIPLTQKGKNYLAVCPFHDDHNPSMVVSREKQIFNCFTCHTGGNVFTFIMKYENVSFLDAVKIVADKLGINVSIHTNTFKSKYDEEYKIMNIASKFYVNLLNTKTGIDAKEYLNKRGITEDIIKDFNIGLSPTNRSELYNFLSNKGFKSSIMESVGLINKSGINFYDVFTDRIMIPISNLEGQIVGYTGRIYHDSNDSKYVNTKDTKIFVKGEILFNYHNAKKFIRESGNIIVVEGNMDAIKMYASGFKNVIALMGTALTKFQINTLKKLHAPVILMLDNDAAGLNATIKYADLLAENGIEVEIIRLQNAKDPDEYIEKYGSKSFEEVIRNPIKYIDFKIKYLKEKYDINSSVEMAMFIRDLFKSLEHADEITKSVIVSRVANEYGIDKELLLKQLPAKTVFPIKQSNDKNIDQKIPKIDFLCQKILYYMMCNSKYIDIFTEEIGCFNDKRNRKIFNDIKYFYKQHRDCVLADFISFFSANSDESDYILGIISNNESMILNFEYFSDLIENLKKEYEKDSITLLKKEIKEETNISKKMELIDKLAKLKKGSVDYDRN